MKTYQKILLALLAIIFSIGLMFAFVELPRLLDASIGSGKYFPGFDHGADEMSAYKYNLFLDGLYLRWIGYGSLALILILIIIGYTGRKSGWAWVGAFALFLPVFGQFALSMFFLAGLGILRVGWLPFIDINFSILNLGDVIYIPYWILIWFFRLFGYYAHDLIAWIFMSAGALLFAFGVMAWFETRFGKQGVATGWIYRFSRHPQYLGWILWSYGFILFTAQLNDMKKSWGVSSSLPWLLSTMVIIGICMLEEINMAKNEGTTYERYRSATPFLFPMPAWLSRVLRFPMKLFIRKEWPVTRGDVARSVIGYTLLFILISLIWFDFGSFREDRDTPKVTLAASQIDSMQNEILKKHERGDIYTSTRLLATAGEDAIPALFNLLESPVDHTREFAVDELGNLKADTAVLKMISLLNDPSSRVRSSAVIALGKIGDERAVEPLVSILYGTDYVLHHRACYALGDIGSPKAWDALVERAKDPVWYRKTAALDGLFRVDAERAMGFVSSALNDTLPQVRRKAVMLIMEHHPVNGDAALMQVIDDEDFETRFYARQALKQY